MRKFQSFLAATALLAAALVAGAASTASAAPGYPGSVDTNCRSAALNNPKAGNPAKVRLRVTAGGDAAARGNVVFQYVRRSDDTVVREFRRSYFGPGTTRYAFNVPKGRYRVKTFFNSRPASSVYQNCRNSFKQRVR